MAFPNVTEWCWAADVQKIRRVCRSTLSDEAHAAATAVDVVLRFQVSPTEISTHDFDYKRPTPPTEFPLINPFRESHTDSEVRQEASLGKAQTILMSVRASNRMMTEEKQTCHATRRCCNMSTALSTITVNDLAPVGRKIYDLAATRRHVV